MYLEIFLADFAFFREFRGISRKYPNFAGPRPREISEALQLGETLQAAPTLLTLEGSNVNSSHFKLTSPLKGIIPPPPPTRT